MITTQGFQVQNMPQFTAPNPALAAFNPNQATEGALAGLNLVGTLDQLKAQRQHNEEFAKLEKAHTDMMQTQSRQAQIKLEHDLALQHIQQEADAAGIKLKGATDTAELPLVPQRAGAESANLALGTARDTTALPNVAPAAKVVQSQTDETQRALDFAKTTEGARHMAEIFKTGLALKTAVEDYQNGDNTEEELKKAEVLNQQAQADFHAAMAAAEPKKLKLESDKLQNQKDIQANHDAARVQAAQMHNQSFQIVSSDLQRQTQYLHELQNEKVADPTDPTNDKFNASQLFDTYFTVGEDGSATLKKTGLPFFKSDQQVPPHDKQLMDEIARTKETVKQSSSTLHEISRQVSGLYKDNPPTASKVLPDANLPVLTVEQYNKIRAQTPEGQEFKFIDVNGVPQRAKGIKKQ